MNNFKYNFVLFILITLVFLVDKSIGVPTDRYQKKCLRVGKTCQNWWDCCSNKCDSFSCIDVGTSSGYMTPNPYFVDSNDDEPEVEIVTSAILPSTGEIYDSSQCFAAGAKCIDSSQCCSNSCFSYLNHNTCDPVILPSSGVMYNSSQCLGIFENWRFFLVASQATKIRGKSSFAKTFDLKCTDSSQCCSNACASFNGLDNVSPLNVSQICFVKREPRGRNKLCKNNGGKCKANWECCSERCEGFPSKCQEVTTGLWNSIWNWIWNLF